MKYGYSPGDLSDEFHIVFYYDQAVLALKAEQQFLCWNTKLMSRDPMELRETLSQIRQRFYRVVGLPILDLRK